MSTPHVQPANWYPDPSGARFLRYWDGVAWTAHTRPVPETIVPAAAPMVLYPQQVPLGVPVGVWRGPADSRPVVRDIFDAVRVCVQKYARFDGRASRPEFWYAQLASLIVAFSALLVVWIPFVGWLALLVLWAFAMASLVPLLAVTVRRLRDAGFHWAWIFICLAPFGSIALLIMCAQPSKHP
ncbi:hypothetical protein GCM10027421_29570 [Microbacterium shaanxiense]